MDRSGVLTLISETFTQNADGVEIPTESERTIFLRSCNSVTRSEFFEGGRNGLKPDLVFVVFFNDYQGEKICKYKGKRYSIYRTFLDKSDNLELYAEEKGGV